MDGASRTRSLGAPKATLNSIAHATGVSRQTVSNVLNAPSRVAEPTRTVVKQEIQRVGYRPSAAARQLRTRRSQLLGFRMREAADGINGSIHDRLLHSLTTRAHGHGYSILVFAALDDDAEIASYQELRDTNALDGFLLTSTNHGDRRSDWLLEHEIPFVAFGRPWGREDGATTRVHDWIDIDGGAGTEAAVRSLADEGARRIGFIGWPEGSGAGDDRFDGFRRACEKRGVEASLIARREDGFDAGADAAAQLVDRDVDALLCVSDSLALGALAHLRSLGRADLMNRLIGFDNTPVARAVGISSIDQPIEEAAHRMVDLLVHRIEQPATEPSSPPGELLTPLVRRRRSATAP
ncbi:MULTISPECIES: LacI family DNA-binding transcriptional regulator [unclassified Brachybacterium]|uniref:LacI family DNA-binding transcriptional regulator n=1 Tax=unclassified Brachybacterium TaxID=2623841 RepID=UPI00402ADAEA